MPDVELTPSGPPSTVLAPESAEALSALAAALGEDLDASRAGDGAGDVDEIPSCGFALMIGHGG